MTDKKVIVISEQDPGLPYSKGLRAAERLLERKVDSVTRDELDELTIDVLSDLAGERYATNFLKWQETARLGIPLVILIGGATGVGKSTIATQIAVRLGIVRVVATDAVREVMRAMFTSELMPPIYTSGFNADSALREPPPRPADRVIVGFREQTAAVAVGVQALVERAAIEGTSVVIEGAHLVPGFVDLERYE